MATRNELEQQAQKLILKGNLHKAIQVYQSIIRSDPRDRRVRQKLGELYLKIERPTDAMKYLRDAADLAVKEGQPRAAIAVYKQIHDLNPHDPEISGLLASCYARVGIAPEAERLYEETINLYTSKRDFTNAVVYAHKLLELRPTDLTIRFRIADLLQKGEKDDEAVQVFRALATLLERRGELGEMARVLEAALETASDDTQMRLKAAEARLAQGDAEKALRLITPMRTTHPRDPRVMEVVSQALIGQGRPEEAHPILLELAEHYHQVGEAESQARILRVALDVGFDDVRIRKLLEAADLRAERLRRRLTDQPMFSPADDMEVTICTKADVELQYGFPDRAEETLRMALIERETSMPLLVRFIELLISTKRRDEAIEHLTNAAGRSRGQAQKELVDRLNVLQGNSTTPSAPEPSHDDSPAEDDLIDDEIIDDEIIDDEIIDDDFEFGSPLLVDDGDDIEEDSGDLGTEDDLRDEDELIEDSEEVFVLEADPLSAGPSLVELGVQQMAAGDLEGALSLFQEAYKENPADEEALMAIAELRRQQRQQRVAPMEIPSAPESEPAPWSTQADGAPEWHAADPGLASAAMPDANLVDDDAIWDALLTDDDLSSVASSPAASPQPAPYVAPPTPRPAAETNRTSLAPDGPIAEARAWAAVGKYREALENIAGQTGLEASWIEACCLRGLGQDPQALAGLRAALADADEQDPAYVFSLLELARIYVNQDRHRAAARLLEELQDLAPDWRPQEIVDMTQGIDLIMARKR